MLPIINWGFLQIPTFYLIISLDICLVLFLLHTDLKKHRDLNPIIAYNLALIIMISGFLGARALHVIYEEPFYYAAHPIEALKFWNGGYVYFGGLAAALISSLVYLKSQKQNFYDWADFCAKYFALSYAIGRLGCFSAGCCFGKACSLPWAVHGLHPVQLYMSMAEFILFFVIYKNIFRSLGRPFFLWLMAHSFLRFMFEFLRDDDRGSPIGSLSISQLIAVIIFATALYANHKLKRKV